MAGFTFNREVNLGQILSAITISITMVSSVFFAYTTLEKRISILETNAVSEQTFAAQVDTYRKNELATFKVDINRDLTRIENKLDRIIMRQDQ